MNRNECWGDYTEYGICTTEVNFFFPRLTKEQARKALDVYE